MVVSFSRPFTLFSVCCAGRIFTPFPFFSIHFIMLSATLIVPFLLPAAYAQLNTLAVAAVSHTICEDRSMADNFLGAEILRHSDRQQRIDRYCLRCSPLKYERLRTAHPRKWAEGWQILDGKDTAD